MKPCILLIEDDGDMRELVAGHLEHSGFDVQRAEDGIKGQALALQYTPDLVLLDLMLPKVDGLEVLHQLRENPATLSLPVAVFTSSKDEEDLLKSRKLHASAFVRKPVNGEEFLRAVGSLGLFWGICHRSGGQT